MQCRQYHPADNRGEELWETLPREHTTPFVRKRKWMNSFETRDDDGLHVENDYTPYDGYDVGPRDFSVYLRQSPPFVRNRETQFERHRYDMAQFQGAHTARAHSAACGTRWTLHGQKVRERQDVSDEPPNKRSRCLGRGRHDLNNGNTLNGARSRNNLDQASCNTRGARVNCDSDTSRKHTHRSADRKAEVESRRSTPTRYEDTRGENVRRRRTAKVNHHNNVRSQQQDRAQESGRGAGERDEGQKHREKDSTSRSGSGDPSRKAGKRDGRQKHREKKTTSRSGSCSPSSKTDKRDELKKPRGNSSSSIFSLSSDEDLNQQPDRREEQSATSATQQTEDGYGTATELREVNRRGAHGEDATTPVERTQATEDENDASGNRGCNLSQENSGISSDVAKASTVILQESPGYNGVTSSGTDDGQKYRHTTHISSPSSDDTTNYRRDTGAFSATPPPQDGENVTAVHALINSDDSRRKETQALLTTQHKEDGNDETITSSQNTVVALGRVVSCIAPPQSSPDDQGSGESQYQISTQGQLPTSSRETVTQQDHMVSASQSQTSDLAQGQLLTSSQFITADSAQQNVDNSEPHPVSIGTLLTTVKQLVVCRSCKKHFNRAVICNAYSIQLNRPIQCSCGCVLCTICYSQHGGCRTHRIFSKHGHINTTANTLASCPELEDLGDWDLELRTEDPFMSDEQVDDYVRFLVEGRVPSEEDLSTAFRHLITNVDNVMTFTFLADQLLPREVAHRYVCIPHVPGFWDHVLVGTRPPPNFEKIISPDDKLLNLFNVSLENFAFHWCCFVFRKQVILAMWFTSLDKNPQASVVTLVDARMKPVTSDPKFKRMVLYLSTWFSAQYEAPDVRNLKVVLDCKLSESPSIVHFIGILASKCGVQMVTDPAVRGRNLLKYNFDRKYANELFTRPYENRESGDLINIAHEYCFRHSLQSQPYAEFEFTHSTFFQGYTTE